MSSIFSQLHSTLTSISGMGPVLGVVIPSDIRGVSCFASSDKLAVYAGVDLMVKQSGEIKYGGIHMSKQGSPFLRRAIVQASSIAVLRDPMFKFYHEKKTAERMRYMNIAGHETEKMTAEIFAVMRDGKIYEPVIPAAV